MFQCTITPIFQLWIIQLRSTSMYVIEELLHSGECYAEDIICACNAVTIIHISSIRPMYVHTLYIHTYNVWYLNLLHWKMAMERNCTICITSFSSQGDKTTGFLDPSSFPCRSRNWVLLGRPCVSRGRNTPQIQSTYIAHLQETFGFHQSSDLRSKNNHFWPQRIFSH